MSQPHSNPNQSQGQGQAEGQLQGQAELQAQLQAQAEAQGQGQGQGQGQHSSQGQNSGQGQGQAQGQSQYAGQYAAQGVDTEVWNSAANSNENGNLSLNGNGNLNANGNLNLNENVNHVQNDVENTVTNNVEISVDLDLGAYAQPLDDDVIDIDEISCIEDSIIMPDVVSQAVESGNNFNIDQVSNLNDQDTLIKPSVSYSAGGLADSYDPCCGSDPASVGDFSMTAKAWGGEANSDIGAITGDDGAFGGIGAAAANASITQEAFTQHIAMGANIQFNSLDISVVNGDVGDTL